MSNYMKCVHNDIEFNSSSLRCVRRDVTCLFDLPDEMLLLIFHYLSITDILSAFHTPLNPEYRLHRVSSDSFKKIKLDELSNNEFIYIIKLFSDCENPLRPKSFLLSNEHVTCLINSFFTCTPEDVIQSMFINLRVLTLIECTEQNLQYLNEYINNLNQLKYLHITIDKPDIYDALGYLESCNLLINQLIFNEKLSSIHTIRYEIYNGLSLNNVLMSHRNLRNINLVLATIDDLYILLNGLIPNVQRLFIQLCQAKIHSRHYPLKTQSICSYLIEFTLLESSTEFDIDDMKSILAHMKNLIRLTLSIHDTFDSSFCHGPLIESILNKYLPHLRQFHYTMTHQFDDDDILIQDFLQWPMNVTYYGIEHSRWIHLYSLPWPANRNDHRRLPIVRCGSKLPVSSDVKRYEYMRCAILTKVEQFPLLHTEFRHAYQLLTSIVIDIELPLHIHKLILSRQIPILTMNSIIQLSIDHLIIERCLDSENEMLILARQFPHVKYLEVFLPTIKSSFTNCLNILLNQDYQIKNCLWSKLIHVSTRLFPNHVSIILEDNQLYQWFVKYGNLKDDKNLSDSYPVSSTLSIWY